MCGVKLGLCLPRRRMATMRREPPDDEALGVDEKPLLLDVGRLGRMGFAEHDGSVSFEARASAARRANCQPLGAGIGQRKLRALQGFRCGIMIPHYASRRDRIGPGRVRDHVGLARRVERDLADREALAELHQPRSADEVGRRRPAQEVDRDAGGDGELHPADLVRGSRHRARGRQSANIAGPEIVPPGRR